MKLVDKIHGKLGDFWYYSLMLFCAQRAADFLNVFVGLWLVPKYVGTAELGAVMPLTTFASALALPVTVFATVFTKEIIDLAERGEYGKLKSLMRGVFAVLGIGMLLAIVVAQFTLPMFLDRIRVSNGSLGFVIIAASFVGCCAPVYSNALQGLKRFTALSLIGAIGAPVRLITMLVTMPFRALTGYFVGQASTPAFAIAASVFCLRKELSVKAERYWTKPVLAKFMRMMWWVGVCSVAGMPLMLIEQTVIRQRLPDVESAAYYMVTRFSDIANFLSAALMTTLFPYTASLANRGKSTRLLVIRASMATIAFGAVLAAIFWLFGREILQVLPNGAEYAEYFWAIPWLIGLTVIGALQSFHINTEVSCARFGFLWWSLPFNLAFAAILLVLTGYGYFVGIVPDSWIAFMTAHNLCSLRAMLWWMTATGLLKLTMCWIELARQKSNEAEVA